MSNVLQPKLGKHKSDNKAKKIRSIFGEVAGSYDALNSYISFNSHHKLRQEAIDVINLKPTDKVLDICCGTGDFFPPILQKIESPTNLIGIDFCEPMLRQAKKKHSEVKILQADATCLPFSNHSFDAVTVGWGLRNVDDIEKTLREAYRVLKPGGRFVSVDMARPTGKFSLASEKACHSIVPKVGAMFGLASAYQYLSDSTYTFASREDQIRLFELAGFKNNQYKDMMFGNICIHWGEKI